MYKKYMKSESRPILNMIIISINMYITINNKNPQMNYCNGYVRNLNDVMARAWRNMRPRWEVNVKETPERQTARCACDNRARISSGNFVNFGVFLTYKSFLVWCYTKPKALGVIILPYMKSTLKKDINVSLSK